MPSGQAAGHVRRLHGGAVAKLVQVTLVVPEIGLDSHMLFAFTDAESAVPHFTLDAVGVGGGYAFHLDLIPRVPLQDAPEYVERAYRPLDEHLGVRELPGLSPAELDERQLACMSPWMFAHRADEGAFRGLGGAVRGYLDHWLELLDKPGTLPTADPATLVEHDRAQRAELFNPEVDPVWHRVEQLLGAEQTRTVREDLLTNSISRDS